MTTRDRCAASSNPSWPVELPRHRVSLRAMLSPSRRPPASRLGTVPPFLADDVVHRRVTRLEPPQIDGFQLEEAAVLLPDTGVVAIQGDSSGQASPRIGDLGVDPQSGEEPPLGPGWWAERVSTNPAAFRSCHAAMALVNTLSSPWCGTRRDRSLLAGDRRRPRPPTDQPSSELPRE